MGKNRWFQINLKNFFPSQKKKKIAIESILLKNLFASLTTNLVNLFSVSFKKKSTFQEEWECYLTFSKFILRFFSQIIFLRKIILLLYSWKSLDIGILICLSPSIHEPQDPRTTLNQHQNYSRQTSLWRNLDSILHPFKKCNDQFNDTYKRQMGEFLDHIPNKISSKLSSYK